MRTLATSPDFPKADMATAAPGTATAELPGRLAGLPSVQRDRTGRSHQAPIARDRQARWDQSTRESA